MSIKLKKEWIRKFQSMPESGMGYHMVDVRLKNGRVIEGVVYNCEYLELIDTNEIRVEEIHDIKIRRKK